MESLKEVYKIGCGPSSSHTMGPQKAASIFKNKNQNAHKYQLYLYGSLAATGKGHMTDYIVIETLKPKETEVFWDASYIHPLHTNYMKLVALDEKNEILDSWEVFSVGGGTLAEIVEGKLVKKTQRKPYSIYKLTEIIKWCEDNNKKLWEFVDYFEDDDIWEYLEKIYDAMEKCIKRGIKKDGYLPAKLKFKRKAKLMYEQYEKAPISLKLTKKNIFIRFSYF